MSERERLRAMAFGQELWGKHASATLHKRYIEQAPNKRRKCQCGCNGRMTHVGMANGLALMGGCEMKVRRWVRDGYRFEGKGWRG